MMIIWSLVPVVWGAVYAAIGWRLVDRRLGDLCINGKPEPSPFPQIRDLAGLGLGLVALLVWSIVVVAVVELPAAVWPEFWRLPWNPPWAVV